MLDIQIQCCITYKLPLTDIKSFLLFVFNCHIVNLACNRKNTVFLAYRVDIERKLLCCFVSAQMLCGKEISFQLRRITLSYYNASMFHEAYISEQTVLHLQLPAVVCITSYFSSEQVAIYIGFKP